MKKVIKILAYLLGGLLLIGLALFAFVSFKALPSYDSVAIPDLKVEATPERLALGQKLVDHNCAGCHRGKGRQLDGILFEDVAARKSFGDFHSANITAHPENGIGAYTDGELYRILRTGIKKNGKLMLPVMPQFVLSSDEDIYAIIAYLRAGEGLVAPSDKLISTPQYSFLARALLNFVIKPHPTKEAYPLIPTPTDSIAFGKYLVDARYVCFACHSAGLDVLDMETPNNTPGYLQGGTIFEMEEYEVNSPSLLMDGESNISSWNEEAFIAALKFGQREGLPAYQKPMHPYPMMDTTEVRAIYHYLKDYSKAQAGED